MEKQTDSFLSWIKLIFTEGLTDIKPSGESVGSGVARKMLNVLSGFAFARFVLNSYLPINTQMLCEYPWYSPMSMYYNVLLSFKGYILMNSAALFLAAIQLVGGIETIQVFNRPFLASSIQDFWGRRWNLIVRNMFFKQVYHNPKTVTGKNQFGRWRAFVLSALIHEYKPLG